jgi:predicted PurR-regulated permease PerM
MAAARLPLSRRPSHYPELVAPPKQQVPWRTIFASVAVVAGALLGVVLIQHTARILAWLVVAGFFALVLSPAVDWVEQHLHLRRGLATGLVFTTVLALVVLMLWAFITPVAHQINQFVDDLPHRVEDARNGKGAIGDIVKRYDLDKKIQENQAKIQEWVSGAGTPALHIVRGIFNTIIAAVTIIALTILLLLRGPKLTAGALRLVREPHRERVRLVAADASKAVSGYMLGNFLISLVAGVATYVVLRLLGVPYPEVLALWVAFADLIPLVGATLGAIPTVGLAFLHSVPAGVIALVFYIVYQQFENHVLQVAVMSKTVDVDPLTVLISVLVGVELFGFLGALLAIPFAGILQVIVRDVYDADAGRFRRTPVIGEDEVPVSEARAPDDD